MVNDNAFVSALEGAGIAGAVAVIGGRDGARYTKAFGMQDVASGIAMADGSIFQIASMTKAIVSVAALQLVERGRLSLDGPIGELLPDLANLQVIDGFDGGGAPILRPARAPITLRHLLTHTSGLGYEFVSADLLRATESLGRTAPGTLASIKFPLLFDPGDKWEYGVSTDWAGLAVEAASGVGLDAYLNTHVCEPLGMTDTVFHPTAAQQPRVASLYARTEDGNIQPFPILIGGGPEAEFLSGGGGLSSTAGDYLRFLRMILNGGALGGVTIVSNDSVGMMTQSQIGKLRAGRMASTMPALANVYESFPGMRCGWGLGFLINPEDGPNGRAAGSLAWAGLANCYYWIDPKNDVIGIFLSQLLPFADPRTLDAFTALERMAYNL
jgi:methyl acetate hydrolase